LAGLSLSSTTSKINSKEESKDKETNQSEDQFYPGRYRPHPFGYPNRPRPSYNKPKPKVEILYFRLKDADGQCIGSTGKKTKLVQTLCGDGDDQIWREIKNKDGLIFVNKQDMAIEIKGGKTDNGTPLTAWTRAGSWNQIWTIEKKIDGYFSLVNPKSKKCVDTTSRHNPGEKLHLYECHKDNVNQYFKRDYFVPRAKMPDQTKFNKPYFRIRDYNDYCLSAGFKRNRLIQRKCDYSEDLIWSREKKGNGYIYINNFGLVIENEKNRNQNKNPLYGAVRNGGPEQIWEIIPRLDGKYFALKNPSSGKCFDTTSKHGPGQFYHLYDCQVIEINQFFRFEEVPQEDTIYFNIKDREGYCLSGDKENSKLTQKKCDFSENLVWTKKRGQNGNNIIVNKKNNMVIDNKLNTTVNGNAIYASTRNGKSTQSWITPEVPGTDESYFQLKNPKTDKCLDNQGKHGNGQNYVINDCKSANKNQQFEFDPVLQWFNIKDNYGNCVSGGDEISGLTQKQCDSTDDMVWRKEKRLDGDGFFFSNRYGMIIDNKDGNSANKNPIIGNERTQRANQAWKYENALNEDDYFLLKNASNGKCISNFGNNKIGEKYFLDDCKNKNKDQFFDFEPVLKWFTITDQYGLCVSAPQNKYNRVTTKVCKIEDSILWKKVKTSTGTFIINKKGMVLNNERGRNNEKNPINISPIGNYADMKWQIDLLENDNFNIINSNKKCFTLNKKDRNFDIRTCNKKNNNQLFSIDYVDLEDIEPPQAPEIIKAPVPKPTNNLFNIKTYGGRCLSAYQLNTRVTPKICSQNQEFLWRKEKQGSGFILINKINRTMEARGTMGIYGKNRTNFDGQIWKVEKINNSEFFRIRNVKLNLCLKDLRISLNVEKCNNSVTTQQFKLEMDGYANTDSDQFSTHFGLN
jgi:hypothetical protein